MGVNRVAIAVKVVRPELLIVGVEIIPLVISTVPSNVLIIHEIWNQVSCSDGHIIKISILCVIGENTKIADGAVIKAKEMIDSETEVEAK